MSAVTDIFSALDWLAIAGRSAADPAFVCDYDAALRDLDHALEDIAKAREALVAARARMAKQEAEEDAIFDEAMKLIPPTTMTADDLVYSIFRSLA